MILLHLFFRNLTFNLLVTVCDRSWITTISYDIDVVHFRDEIWGLLLLRCKQRHAWISPLCALDGWTEERSFLEIHFCLENRFTELHNSFRDALYRLAWWAGDWTAGLLAQWRVLHAAAGWIQLWMERWNLRGCNLLHLWIGSFRLIATSNFRGVPPFAFQTTL